MNWCSITSNPNTPTYDNDDDNTVNDITNVVSLILLCLSLAYTGFSTYNTISQVVPPAVTDISAEEGQHIKDDTKPEDYSTMNSDAEADYVGEKTPKKINTNYGRWRKSRRSTSRNGSWK